MMTPHRTYVIEGILEKAYDVEREIVDDLERLGYDDNALFSIRLAMDEALINGLKHGNKNDPTRSLRIAYGANAKKVEISVQDEGPGFDYRTVVDPTTADNLRRTHGRGIFLIRKFMDEVRFNETGNKITFVFFNDKEHPESGELFGMRWLLREGVVILLVEDLTPLTVAEDWEGRIEHIVMEGRLKIVVDMSRLEYINSSGLAFLVLLAQKMREASGMCCLTGVRERVQEVLKVTNLSRLLPIHPDLESAIKALKKPQR